MNKCTCRLTIRAVEKYGDAWSLIRELVPGRTDVQIRERYKYCLDPLVKRGPWQQHEVLRFDLFRFMGFVVLWFCFVVLFCVFVFEG